MQYLIVSTLICILSIVSPIENYALGKLDPNNESWIQNCQSNKCLKAFETCTKIRCRSSQECQECMVASSPKCEKCGDLVLKQTPNPMCDSADPVQEEGCKFYCAGNQMNYGSCHSVNGQKKCRCSNEKLNPCASYEFYDGLSKTCVHKRSMQEYCNNNGECDATLSCLSNSCLCLVNELWNSITKTCDKKDRSIRLDYHTDIISSMAVTSNGDLITASEDGKTIIWNMINGSIKNILRSNEHGIWGMLLLSDDQLATASNDHEIKIWDHKKGVEVRALKGHTHYVSALSPLMNGDIASGSYDQSVIIWDLENGTIRIVLKEHLSPILALALLPNGDLASSSYDSNIKIWDPNTGNLKKILSGHANSVYTLRVLKNGDLASGSADTTIKIWNLQSGTVKKTLYGHSNKVAYLIEHDNGDLLSASHDNTIKFWDINTSTVKKTLKGNTPFWCLAILPNGDIAAGDHYGSIKIYNL